MKPTFVKKNTEGSAAGHSWEAGEVKALNSRLAEELVVLAPEDYEIVSEDEYTPESTESTVVEEETEEESKLNEEDQATLDAIAEEVKDLPVLPVKPTTTRKSNKKTETPSAE